MEQSKGRICVLYLV